MKKLLGAMPLCLGLVIANHAAAESCNGPGSANARILDLPHSDENARTAMAAAIALGLSPYNFPMNRIAEIAAPCKRLHFSTGDGVYSLYGSDRIIPPRYAMRDSDKSRIAYLARLPLPNPALAALRAGPQNGKYRFKPPEMIFVLAITDGYQRPFFRFYDSIPDDHTLAVDMCAALMGEDDPIGAYNSSYGNTVFYRPTLAKRTPHAKCRVAIS